MARIIDSLGSGISPIILGFLNILGSMLHIHNK